MCKRTLIAIPLLLVASGCEELGTPSQSTTQPTGYEANIQTRIVSNRIKQDDEWGIREQILEIELENLGEQKQIIHLVLYAKNDRISPPRRYAWPFSGLLFKLANTRRGQLHPSDIQKNWQSRPENTKGWKDVLLAHGSKRIECSLPLNTTSQHEAWNGQEMNPRAVYEEFHIWLFTEDGRRILPTE